MTTLYEHSLLGSKIFMVSADFNIPFLTGDGSICLYESGITLLDSDGDEKYIVEINGFSVKYEKFINVRSLKYLSSNKIFLKNSRLNFKIVKPLYKRVKGIFYGKFVISIPQIGDVVLLDNKSFKYKSFYEKIQSLKRGINPLYNRDLPKKNKIREIFKFKFNNK